jgi:hypothetical protein
VELDGPPDSSVLLPGQFPEESNFHIYTVDDLTVFPTRNVTKFIFTLMFLYVAVNCWRPILSGGSSNKVVCVLVCVCVCVRKRERERRKKKRYGLLMEPLTLVHSRDLHKLSLVFTFPRRIHYTLQHQ